MMNDSFFLMEQGIRQEPQIVKIDSSRQYAKWKMAMQDADVVNKNKRIYPRSVLEQGLRDAEDRFRSRAFIGEMDHPLPTGNFDEVRQTTVLLKESSHVITDYEWKGNILYGTFETLSEGNGRKAYGLVKDKIGFGTSMRGMAELDRQSGYNMVRGPLYLVTYDLVSNPSHKIAVIDEKQVTFEGLQHRSDSSANKLLTESSNGDVVYFNDVCYLSNYFDKLVEQKVIEFYNRWI